MPQFSMLCIENCYTLLFYLVLLPGQDHDQNNYQDQDFTLEFNTRTIGFGK